jgi:hypothetical protein
VVGLQTLPKHQVVQEQQQLICAEQVTTTLVLSMEQQHRPLHIATIPIAEAKWGDVFGDRTSAWSRAWHASSEGLGSHLHLRVGAIGPAWWWFQTIRGRRVSS